MASKIAICLYVRWKLLERVKHYTICTVALFIGITTQLIFPYLGIRFTCRKVHLLTLWTFDINYRESIANNLLFP